MIMQCVIYITKKEIVSGRRHAVAYTAQKRKEIKSKNVHFFLLSFFFLYIIYSHSRIARKTSFPYIAKNGYLLGMPITTQPESSNNKRISKHFSRRKQKTRANSKSKRQREAGSVSFEEDEARKFS